MFGILSLCHHNVLLNFYFSLFITSYHIFKSMICQELLRHTLRVAQILNVKVAGLVLKVVQILSVEITRLTSKVAWVLNVEAVEATIGVSKTVQTELPLKKIGLKWF